jgi:type II secretory pathway pseudopilin PulG
MRARFRHEDGMAMLDVMFVCGIIGLLSSIALPRFALAKQAAGAASAIGSMRTIASSQLTYALTCGNGFYAPNLRVLGTPPPGSNEPFIGAGLGEAMSVQRSSYTFRLEGAPFGGAPATCNGLGRGQAARGYAAGADPTEPTNFRFFATNADAQLWEADITLYDDIPEVGEPPFGWIVQ